MHQSLLSPQTENTITFLLSQKMIRLDQLSDRRIGLLWKQRQRSQRRQLITGTITAALFLQPVKKLHRLPAFFFRRPLAQSQYVAERLHCV